MKVHKEIQWFIMQHRDSLLYKGMNRIPPCRAFFDYIDLCAADVHIISYPKCGRTWLKYMLAHYLLYTQQPDFGYHSAALVAIHRLNPEIPLIRFSPDTANFIKPRKVNHYLYKNQKIAFLVREIKDVLVSAFHHAKDRIALFEGTLSGYIRHAELGVKRVVEYYNSWYKDRVIPRGFIILRYEELHADPFAVMEKLLVFIGLIIDEHSLKKAIGDSTFQKMYAAQFKSNEGTLKVDNTANQNSFKVRKGKVGGYRQELSDKDIDFLDSYIHHNLNPALRELMGYE